jgi:uncharacterized membrane protein YdfJ with MMPL/SSD domain
MVIYLFFVGGQQYGMSAEQYLYGTDQRVGQLSFQQQLGQEQLGQEQLRQQQQQQQQLAQDQMLQIASQQECIITCYLSPERDKVLASLSC